MLKKLILVFFVLIILIEGLAILLRQSQREVVSLYPKGNLDSSELIRDSGQLAPPIAIDSSTICRRTSIDSPKSTRSPSGLSPASGPDSLAMCQRLASDSPKVIGNPIRPYAAREWDKLLLDYKTTAPSTRIIEMHPPLQPAEIFDFKPIFRFFSPFSIDSVLVSFATLVLTSEGAMLFGCGHGLNVSDRSPYLLLPCSNDKYVVTDITEIFEEDDVVFLKADSLPDSLLAHAMQMDCGELKVGQELYVLAYTRENRDTVISITIKELGYRDQKLGALISFYPPLPAGFSGAAIVNKTGLFVGMVLGNDYALGYGKKITDVSDTLMRTLLAFKDGEDKQQLLRQSQRRNKHTDANLWVTGYLEGNGHVKSGRYNLALLSFYNSLDFNSTSTEILGWIGFCYGKLGMWPLAKLAYLRMVEIEPYNVEAHYLLGIACLYLRDLECVSEQLDFLKGHDPELYKKLLYMI